MNEEKTLGACPVLGVSAERKEVKALVELLPLPWKEWWAHMSKFKSVTQWQSKLRAFDELDEDSWIQETKTYAKIGTTLFQHVDGEGEWHTEPIQDTPQ